MWYTVGTGSFNCGDSSESVFLFRNWCYFLSGPTVPNPVGPLLFALVGVVADTIQAIVAILIFYDFLEVLQSFRFVEGLQ